MKKKLKLIKKKYLRSVKCAGQLKASWKAPIASLTARACLGRWCVFGLDNDDNNKKN